MAENIYVRITDAQPIVIKLADTMTVHGFENPMTTLGDMVMGGVGGEITRLPVSSNGTVLKTVNGRPQWTQDHDTLADVATSGSYTDLSDKPTIPTVPDLADVATSGDYNDLENKPTIPVLPNFATVATSGSYNDLSDKPSIPELPLLADVATSGDYNDLDNLPTIPTLPTLASVATSGSYNDLADKPTIPELPELAPVATSGDYNDLQNKPTIEDFPELAPVATSGSYNDLTDKPTIDDLPDLAPVAISGDYDDLTNKPTIPIELNDLSDVDFVSQDAPGDVEHQFLYFAPDIGWIPTSISIDLVDGLQDDLNAKLFRDEVLNQDGMDDSSEELPPSQQSVKNFVQNSIAEIDIPDVSGKANTSDLTAHTSDTDNPHATTKAQVGLGNVDNTSDADKPVSTAQQTALDDKQDTLVSGTNIKTVNGVSILGSGDLEIEGGGGAGGSSKQKILFMNGITPSYLDSMNYSNGGNSSVSYFTNGLRVSQQGTPNSTVAVIMGPGGSVPEPIPEVSDITTLFGTVGLHHYIYNSPYPSNGPTTYFRWFATQTNLSDIITQSNTSCGHNVSMRLASSHGSANTTWHTVVGNGTSATQTAIGTSAKGVPRYFGFAFNDVGDIEITDLVTGSLVSTHTTNKPTVIGTSPLVGVIAHNSGYVESTPQYVHISNPALGVQI